MRWVKCSRLAANNRVRGHKKWHSDAAPIHRGAEAPLPVSHCSAATLFHEPNYLLTEPHGQRTVTL